MNYSRITKDTDFEKRNTVKPFESNLDILFENFYREFLDSPLFLRNDVPTYGGIYAIYDKKKAIYVGRADNIKKRIQFHTRASSDIGAATFAFNLAKKELGRLYVSRKDYVPDPDFQLLFIQKKAFLYNCKFRCVKIPNDLLQTLFEPYLAYKLETYPKYNTFENH